MDNLEVREKCLKLAKKFGFVPRAVVWDFICPKGRTARYKHWRELQKSPLFSPYILGSGFPEYLILSQKGRSLVGMDALSEVPTVYLEHDEIVMRFFLLLQDMDFIEQSWSEGELRMDRVLAINSLGDGVLAKLPDLLFDLKMEGTPVRYALEIERTRKSQGRYQTMRRAYQRADNVDVLLFGVVEEKIEELIQREIAQAGLELYGKDIGFFDLTEFREKEFQTTLRIAGKEIPMREYFLAVITGNSASADFRRHGVRAELREVSGAS